VRHQNIAPGEEFTGYGASKRSKKTWARPSRNGKLHPPPPALSSADKNGDILHGAKNYRLNIPANAPAKDFWSVVISDPQTRSELQTSQPFPSKNDKRDKLIVNADGSVDLYFGPKAPKGKEANWTQTIAGKSWFAILRLYGPLDAWFEKKWRPGEIEMVR